MIADLHGGTTARAAGMLATGGRALPEPAPFWNPRTGIFDAAQLRLAIVLRRWTVVEFARAAKVSPACLYNALQGRGVTDRTAIRIFQGLQMREPTLIVAP